MIAVFSDLPSHCPRCGSDLSFTGVLAAGRRREAMRGISQVCQCGLKWAVISKFAITKAATEDGSDVADHLD